MNPAAQSPSQTIRDTARRLGRDPDHQFHRRMPTRSRYPRQPEPSRPARSTVAGKTLWYLSFILIAAALCMAAFAQFVGGRMALAGHTTDATRHEIAMAEDVLNVPANFIRFAEQRRRPSLDRLDLYMHWPTLSGYTEGLSGEFRSAKVNPAILFVTVEPRKMTLDMSGRAGPLYSKFLVGAESDAGYGLRKRQLSAAAGFLNEDFYYEIGNDAPFAARCVRAGSSAMAPYCMRDIQVGRSLMVTYRFHLSLITDWRRLDAAIRQVIQSMLVDREAEGDQASRSMSRIAMEKL